VPDVHDFARTMEGVVLFVVVTALGMRTARSSIKWNQQGIVAGGTVATRRLVWSQITGFEQAGGASLVANRDAVGLWETFTTVPQPDGTTALRAAVNGRYVTAEQAGIQPLIANRTAVGPWEKSPSPVPETDPRLSTTRAPQSSRDATKIGVQQDRSCCGTNRVRTGPGRSHHGRVPPR